MRRRIRGIWLGRRRYQPIHQLQWQLHTHHRSGAVGDTVLLLEHEPVITFGRGGSASHLLAPPDLLAQRGIDVVGTDRGGDVTLHAPGQLVCYPILGLAPDRRDVRRYVGDLIETMRRLAREWGVAAGTVDGLVGLWVDRRDASEWPGQDRAQDLAKLGAVGVRLSRWVTMHGFALNLSTDLDLFSLIVPCGIRQHAVTSLQAVSPRPVPSVAAAAARALQVLAEILDADLLGLEDWSAHRLLAPAVATTSAARGEPRCG
jgi:lipoyl(octanoyl) transferase